MDGRLKGSHDVFGDGLFAVPQLLHLQPAKEKPPEIALRGLFSSVRNYALIRLTTLVSMSSVVFLS